MNPKRRHLLQGTLAAAVPHWAAAADDAPAGARKVLRLLLSSAETGFDPARISDLYSRVVTAHIFESLYFWDYLAPRPTLRPLLAEALPEVSADFRQFTFRLRRGVYFADDPAFGGKPREVQARDQAYALQRLVDPANLSPVASDILDFGILGLAAVREAALKSRQPFDYDRPIEGLTTPDPYTLQIKLAAPRPRLADWFADLSILGAQAREVVEHYRDTIAEHPVGCGPFRLKSWRRNSRIVLERNPAYRERLYDAQPAANDAEGQALLARYKGRRLPLVDEVQLSVVEEFQPQWLSFLNAQVDGLVSLTGGLPTQFVPVAAPGGKLAPNLAKRGVRLDRRLVSTTSFIFFNMDDPTIGGLEAPQVALRRAVSLAYDVDADIRLFRSGQAVPAQGMVSPYCSGYDPAFKTEMADHDPARANALLDLYGFVDRNGDGWRERPDGSPLELVMHTEPEQIYRIFNDLWRKAMAAIGLRLRFVTQQWPENLKAADAGTLMIWSLSGAASLPDGADSMSRYDSKLIGAGNFARFKLPAMDRLFERLQVLPDGPERERVFFDAKRLATAYMPYKPIVHRVSSDLMHPWMLGFRRPMFASDWWQYIDVDTALRTRLGGDAH